MSAPIVLPKWVDLALVPALNVATAFAISGLVVLAIGENPLHAVRSLVAGSLGSAEGLGFTLYYATNFIFTGLAVALAYRAGLFNIGGEGQAYVAGLGAALVCLHLDFLPAILLLPAGVLGAAAFGAAWAIVPAWLQARRGSHIVITTIMFNWLATTLMAYLLVNVMREPQSMQPETRVFAPNGRLPQLHDIAGALGLPLPATPLNLAFLLALVAAFLVWLLLWRTRLGYEIRTVGLSPTAADYAGISTTRVIVVTMALSGALCGGLAVNEIMGVQHRLLLEFTSGYGFVGIAVALMGRAHPVGVVLASLLFGMLYQGGAELAFDQPKITRDMIVVIQGLVVLFAGALEGVFRAPLARLFAPAGPEATT
ncbi:MAG: ABC transporter permease [Rhizobiales bacterium]|nr:ABC transporter permease [Hyphomicrobiales bacterium]